jgi:hypothetical protein
MQFEEIQKETDKLPSYKKVDDQVQLMDYQKEGYDF